MAWRVKLGGESDLPEIVFITNERAGTLAASPYSCFLVSCIGAETRDLGPEELEESFATV